MSKFTGWNLLKRILSVKIISNKTKSLPQYKQQNMDETTILEEYIQLPKERRDTYLKSIASTSLYSVLQLHHIMDTRPYAFTE